MKGNYTDYRTLINRDIYGGLSIHDNAVATALAQQDVWYQLTIFDTNNDSNGCTPDHTNDHITINIDGEYYIGCAFSCESAQSNAYEFHVSKNNNGGHITNMHGSRQTTTANKPGSVSMMGSVDCSVGDTIEVWVLRTNGLGVAKSITITYISLSLHRVGG